MTKKSICGTSRLVISVEFFCVDVMENKNWVVGKEAIVWTPNEDNKEEPCNCPCFYDHGGCSQGIIMNNPDRSPDCSCTGPPCIGTCTGRG